MIYKIGSKSAKSKVGRSKALSSEYITEVSDDITRFEHFWALMDTIHVHGYIRAAMSVIGRSSIGAWWYLGKDTDFGDQATERQRKKLLNVYNMPNREWTNVKDYYSFAYKLMIAVMYLRYFGQAAFYIVRNSSGQPIGLDFLHGYVCPNVDSSGYFKTPAFIQYPTDNPSIKVEFNNPRDIIFITTPDWKGYPSGGTDIESLSEYSLPIDLYLQLGAREYIKNRDKPEAFYILPSDISDEAFENFVKALEERYRGPRNMGKSPIAVQGDLDIKELSKMPSDLPYQESRHDVRDEVLAVAGVAGSKLGLTSALSSANLRESRREFHETTMIPLFRIVEQGLYEQLHVREFGVYGWAFKFHNPDFLNAVEKATVHMRYIDMSVLNPNEVRYELGKAPYSGGDSFHVETPAGRPGSPPEGMEDEPDAPAQTGEPTLDDQDPPRGDQHDEELRNSLIGELRQWRSYAMNRLKRNKPVCNFKCHEIPDYLHDAIQAGLDNAGTLDEIKNIFSEIERTLDGE